MLFCLLRFLISLSFSYLAESKKRKRDESAPTRKSKRIAEAEEAAEAAEMVDSDVEVVEVEEEEEPEEPKKKKRKTSKKEKNEEKEQEQEIVDVEAQSLAYAPWFNHSVGSMKVNAVI